MKNAHRMVVAHGDVVPEVLAFVCKDFGRLVADIDEMEDVVVTEYIASDNRYLATDINLEERDIQTIIECLDDHISNSTHEELASTIAEPDYMCANPIHVQCELECRCSLPDCIHTRVYEHTYYGPYNTIVTAYYVLAD